MLNNNLLLAAAVLFVLMVAFSHGPTEGFSAQYYDFNKYVPYFNYRHPYDTKLGQYYDYPYDESTYYNFPPYYDRFRDNYPYYDTAYRSPPL